MILSLIFQLEELCIIKYLLPLDYETGLLAVFHVNLNSSTAPYYGTVNHYPTATLVP